MLRLTLALSCLALSCGGFTTQRGVSATHRAKTVYTGDFITATKIVGKYYGRRTRDWLVNCSSSEGGHGEFVWFGHLSYPRYGYSTTPGGWMQFMGSTFRHNMDWAFIDARHRGLRARAKARSYYEPLGQAIVAGAMYYYHGSGPWTGVYC